MIQDKRKLLGLWKFLLKYDFFSGFPFPNFFFFFFSIGIHSSKVEQQLQGTELQEKEVQKD